MISSYFGIVVDPQRPSVYGVSCANFLVAHKDEPGKYYTVIQSLSSLSLLNNASVGETPSQSVAKILNIVPIITVGTGYTFEKIVASILSKEGKWLSVELFSVLPVFPESSQVLMPRYEPGAEWVARYDEENNIHLLEYVVVPNYPITVFEVEEPMVYRNPVITAQLKAYTREQYAKISDKRKVLQNIKAENDQYVYDYINNEYINRRKIVNYRIYKSFSDPNFRVVESVNTHGDNQAYINIMSTNRSFDNLMDSIIEPDPDDDPDFNLFFTPKLE